MCVLVGTTARRWRHCEGQAVCFNSLLDSELSIRIDASERLIRGELQFCELGVVECANPAVECGLGDRAHLKRECDGLRRWSLCEAAMMAVPARRARSRLVVSGTTKTDCRTLLRASLCRSARRPQAFVRSVPGDGERQGSPTTVRLASTPVLTVERGSPVIKTRAREFGILGLKRGEPCQVPAGPVRLANDDHANSFTRSQVERLGRAEDAVLVEGFNRSH